MSDSPITGIYFVAPGVFLGGALKDYWSNKPGQMDEASRFTTVTDRGDRGVVLHYRAGTVRQDVTVYTHMIRQVVREAPQDAPAPNGGKK